MIRRRDFLQLSAAAVAAQAAPAPRRIAAITTTYHVRSHADNLITRLLEGYWINDQHYQPACRVVSLFMDQVHPADIGYRLSTAYDFPVKETIADALTLGTGKLAVDGVMVVAEHGNYPFNNKQQQMYPRFEFFSEIVKVFRASGRSVPVFTDKHLSWDWKRAQRMVEWSRELKFPLMAGSSLPVTFRRPELDFPLDVELEDALMVGGGWVSDGGIFHNLETLQCFVERRRGGETGIRAVQYIEGADVWRPKWPRHLLAPALSRAEKLGPGRAEDVKNPVLCLLEYNDGFRAALLMLPGMVNEFLVAFQRKGRAEPESTLCYVPPENSNNFSMLAHGAVQMFTTGQPPYPVERTLLTTGADAFLMESAWRHHTRLETPELKVTYRAPRESFYAHGRGS